jgi:hypothetical protein
MPSWANMNNLATGDLLTEADMDTMRGNIEYLLNPNSALVEYDNSADYTTTSSSWVDVDSTNITLPITTNGGPLWLWALVTLITGGVSDVGLRIVVDGTPAVTWEFDNVYTNGRTICGFYTPSVGTHTVKLQWKSDGTNTLTMCSNGQAVVLGAQER